VLECSLCGELIDSNEPHVTAIVPFYKSEDHVQHVLEFISDLNNKIKGGVNAIFVIDGSPDKAEEIIRESIEKSPYPVQVIALSRNFGVGPALHAALADESNSCMSMVFGSDLQEPNDLFVKFAESILSGECSVALGQRESRDDPLGMRITSTIYWFLYRKLISRDTPKGGYDVFGISTVARQALVALPEQNTNITAQVQWIGFKRKYFSFVRQARISGKSTWTFRKRFGLFIDTFLGFSDKFLLLIYSVAIFLIGFGLLIGTLVAVSENLSDRVNNLLTSMFFFSQGVVVLTIALIGSISVRNFDNSKNRPKYIIETTFQNSRGREILQRGKQ
jgi:glycosyltransferase involved in cell wall biosynthesis